MDRIVNLKNFAKGYLPYPIKQSLKYIYGTLPLAFAMAKYSGIPITFCRNLNGGVEKNWKNIRYNS